jgi:hypothetical protein
VPRSLLFRPASLVVILATLVAAAILASCGAFTNQQPSPTPTDFAGIVAELDRAGISVDNVTSGDAGCADQRLARTAIGFDARGADQQTPVRVRLYAFKIAPVFDQLRPSVDQCARSFVTDPSAYSTVDATPYVLAGNGPWPPAFKDALRGALERAATGG